MICVYCSEDFAPEVKPGKPRAVCPHCNKTNGLKVWDVGQARYFAPYRMGRGGTPKVMMTFRLPKDVVDYLRAKPNQSEYLAYLLTQDRKSSIV